MNVQCGREVKCWACSITDERRSRYSGQSVWELYERAVEAIEATHGEFRIPDVWQRAGRGPAMHNAFRNAIRDMHLHGLVRCVERASNPNRCLTWVVNR